MLNRLFKRSSKKVTYAEFIEAAKSSSMDKLEFVDQYINQNRDNLAKINKVNKDGHSALAWAIEQGHPAILSALLATPGIDHQGLIPAANAAILRAAEGGNLAQLSALLTIPGIDINAVDTFGNTALIGAIQQGHLATVNALLAFPGIDVNIIAKSGKCALAWACEKNCYEIIDILLAMPGIILDGVIPVATANAAILKAANGGKLHQLNTLLTIPEININTAEEKAGETALIWVAYRNHLTLLPTLLTSPGIDINAVDKFGNTALVWAVKRGHLAMIKALLAIPGIDINACALMQAVKHKIPMPLISRLLAGINKNIAADITAAIDSDNLDGINVLHLLPAKVLQELMPHINAALVRAAKAVNTPNFIALLAIPGINVNTTNEKGESALSNALQSGQMEMIDSLLALPEIDVNAKTQDGVTPLIYALKAGKTSRSIQLLAHPNISHQGVVPVANAVLFKAASEGNSLLLNSILTIPGLNINSVDSNGDSALNIALRNGHSDCVDHLLSSPGIKINDIDSKGYPPLISAVQKCSLYIVTRLLAMPDININAVDHEGHTAIIRAILNAYSDKISILLSVPGVDMRGVISIANKALVEAVRVGELNLLNTLLTIPGININYFGSSHFNALLWAVQNNDLSAVNSLLAIPGIDLGVIRGQYNALHLAAKDGREAIVTALLAKIEDINILNQQCRNGIHSNETPIFIANKKGHLRIVALIRTRINELETMYANVEEKISIQARLAHVLSFKAQLNDIVVDDTRKRLCCPISLELMEDPITVSSGITFDRRSLEGWFNSMGNPLQAVCPITRLPIKITELKIGTARLVLDFIEEYVADQKEKHAARILAETGASSAVQTQGVSSANQPNQDILLPGGIIPFADSLQQQSLAFESQDELKEEMIPNLDKLLATKKCAEEFLKPLDNLTKSSALQAEQAPSLEMEEKVRTQLIGKEKKEHDRLTRLRFFEREKNKDKNSTSASVTSMKRSANEVIKP